MVDQTSSVLLKLKGDRYPCKAAVNGDMETTDITDLNNAVKNMVS